MTSLYFTTDGRDATTSESRSTFLIRYTCGTPQRSPTTASRHNWISNLSLPLLPESLKNSLFLWNHRASIYLTKFLVTHAISLSNVVKMETEFSMIDRKKTYIPSIIYRPIQPSDLEALEQVHANLFPIRYNKQFFLDVVSGNSIVSWAAVVINRQGSQKDELVGFITARIIPAKESEIEDILKSDAKDQVLAYILTLGVVERFRKFGIGSSLTKEVINYASSITNCAAVYLHVISYNQPAILFYKKMNFKLIRHMPEFYYINGQHFDSYLFAYFLDEGTLMFSPLGLIAVMAAYFRRLFTSLVHKLWRNDDKIPQWSKYKETNNLLITRNQRFLGANEGCESV